MRDSRFASDAARRRLGGAAIAAALLCAPAALALDDDTFDDVAIIIGNRTYEQGVAPVEFAHNDAEAMKRFVVDVLGFDEENVIVLKDATKNQLETHFSKGGILEDWISPDGASDVIVFYSGHGVPGLQDSNSYLLPVDGNPNKAELSGYPLADFYANLKALKAKSVTVYLDACFSGDSGGGVLFRDASPVFQAGRKTVAPVEVTVIAAAQADQIASWDREAQHGLFTHHLLDALYGAADDDRYGAADGEVTVAEVAAYLKRHMSRAARRGFGRQQDAAVSGADGVVLARLDAATRPARPQVAALPPAGGGTADRPAAQERARTAALTPPTAGQPQLDPVDETYVTMKNANVRDEPSVQGAKVTTLPEGTRVTALGKVRGEDWYLIAQDGREIGYIYGNLMLPEAEGQALLQQQQEQARRQATAPPTAGGAALRGRPQARQAGVTRVYVQGVSNNAGADMSFLSDVVRGVAGAVPGTQLLGERDAGSSDVVISGRVTRVEKQTVANPEAQGAAMASAIFGNLVRQLNAHVPQAFDIYAIEVTVSALDRHSGRTLIEKGYHETKVAAGTPSAQATFGGLQAATSDATERLLVTLSGGVPPPRTAGSSTQPGMQQWQPPSQGFMERNDSRQR